MLFNSVEFWFFLPIVWLVYFVMPFKIRWVWLLIASYYFYSYWKLEFAGLMLFTSFLDWFAAKQLHKSEIKWKRLTWLWLAILSDIGMLFLFKYFNFALGDSNLAKSMYQSQWTAWIIELGKYTIPAGISFYTFQSISYVVDVYRGDETPEKSLPKFLLYVSFFPQLVAGPIERFGKLHSQLFAQYSPRWEDVRNGLRLLIFGLFLKVAIADNLAGVVDDFYANPSKYNLLSTWVATFLFTFQVYLDFFGYSLLAQGAALLFGIHLMDNFNKPFLAKSIPEFWHRWHISLSTWFRDYVFIPVGGNKNGPVVLAFAVMLVFFTSGLWHGANITMIYFGLSQGFLYLFDRFIFKNIQIQSVVWERFKQIKTGLFFMITLVFFRSGTIEQAKLVYKQMLGSNLGIENIHVGLLIWLFLIVGVVLDNNIMKERADSWLGKLPFIARWSLYVFFIGSIAMFGGAVNHPFVYFQF